MDQVKVSQTQEEAWLADPRTKKWSSNGNPPRKDRSESILGFVSLLPSSERHPGEGMGDTTLS